MCLWDLGQRGAAHTVSAVPVALLVRHGRTTSNVSGTLAGWSEGVGLDDTGREQVRALAARLGGMPVVRLVSSPLQRCQETAALLAEGLGGIAVSTDDGLGECRYGAWTGRSLAELAKEPLWRTVQDHPSAARFPYSDEYAAESLAEMAVRAVSAVRRHDAAVAAEHGPDALWVGVSHGDVLKAIVSDAAGAHLDEFQRIMVDPASLSVVRYTPRRPFVIRVNDFGTDLKALIPPPEKPAEADEGGGAEADGSEPADTSGDAPVGGGAGPSAAGPTADAAAGAEGQDVPGD